MLTYNEIIQKIKITEKQFEEGINLAEGLGMPRVDSYLDSVSFEQMGRYFSSTVIIGGFEKDNYLLTEEERTERLNLANNFLAKTSEKTLNGLAEASEKVLVDKEEYEQLIKKANKSFVQRIKDVFKGFLSPVSAR